MTENTRCKVMFLAFYGFRCSKWIYNSETLAIQKQKNKKRSNYETRSFNRSQDARYSSLVAKCAGHGYQVLDFRVGLYRWPPAGKTKLFQPLQFTLSTGFKNNRRHYIYIPLSSYYSEQLNSEGIAASGPVNATGCTVLAAGVDCIYSVYLSDSQFDATLACGEAVVESLPKFDLNERLDIEPSYSGESGRLNTVFKGNVYAVMVSVTPAGTTISQSILRLAAWYNGGAVSGLPVWLFFDFFFALFVSFVANLIKPTLYFPISFDSRSLCSHFLIDWAEKMKKKEKK